MKSSDIQVMVKTVSKRSKSALCLLYKDARYDQDALDAKYGVMGWQNQYRMVGDILLCAISVWDREKECWVTKENAGNETQVGEDKGYASDAFKRAATNWGFGRELYRAPDIWIDLYDNEIGSKPGSGGKEMLYCKQKFYVSHIRFSKGSVSSVMISDANGNIRFSWNAKEDQFYDMPPEPEIEEMREIAREKVEKTTKFNDEWKVKVLKGIHKYDEKTLGRLLSETLKED